MKVRTIQTVIGSSPKDLYSVLEIWRRVKTIQAITKIRQNIKQSWKHE